MRFLLVLGVALSVAAMPGTVQAGEMAEALAKLRASFARTAFSHFKAMPLHVRYDVTVGEVIRIDDEQPLVVSDVCYNGLETRADAALETTAVDLSRNASIALGLGGEAAVYGIPAAAK